jgi:hypothetical protein
MKNLLILIKCFSFSLILAILASCAANPVQVPIIEESDANLDCRQLSQELKRAHQYKMDARKDDRFRFQDIIITNGLMSIYNINKAEKNATKRIEHIQKLIEQKNCSAQNNFSYPNAPANAMVPSNSANSTGYNPYPTSGYNPSTAPSYPAEDIPYDLSPSMMDTPYPVR